MTETVQLHVIISGRVQGVFFRAETKKTADSLNVKGWVKNLTDGSVEALFEGEKEAVRKMMQWCHDGPPAARVDQIKTRSAAHVSGFRSFDIQY